MFSMITASNQLIITAVVGYNYFMVKIAHIFGAGISGVTCARQLSDYGYTVNLYERNNHIGGCVYDYVQDEILVHKYGPHIFHTNNHRVYEFLSRFTVWTLYTHKVAGFIDGQFVAIPFNLTSLKQLFPKSKAEKIENILINEYGKGNKISVLELTRSANKKIAEFGKYVYDKVFYRYTLKQWGFTPDKLPKGVCERVPVNISTDDRYFTDIYQCMPAGYTNMLRNMLAVSNINVILNSKHKLSVKNKQAYIDGTIVSGEQIVVYSGSIDELFDFSLGALIYRTLRFEFEKHNTPSYQPQAVVNYTMTEDYTRISEFTKFTCKQQSHTIIVKEYPSQHIPLQTVPYYPIDNSENAALYNKYLSLISPNLYLIGRLAQYKYINMDIAVANALELTDKIISSDNS